MRSFLVPERLFEWASAEEEGGKVVKAMPSMAVVAGITAAEGEQKKSVAGTKWATVESATAAEEAAVAAALA